MAIKPIDLQTNFLRTENVGREQSAEKEALAHQQARQGEKAAHQSEVHSKQVNETENLPDQGAEQASADAEGKGYKEPEPKEKKDKEEEPDKNIYKDPALGQNIDISG